MVSDRQTCSACRHWHQGYMIQRLRVPSFCARHHHSQRGNDPACRDFGVSDEAELGITGFYEDGSPY